MLIHQTLQKSNAAPETTGAEVENQAPTEQKSKKRKSTESESGPAANKTKCTGNTTKEKENKTDKEIKESTKKSKGVGKDNGIVDASDIYLEGEHNGTMPIYETASDIRRHITTLLENSSETTRRGFLEASSAASNAPVSAQNLTTFRKRAVRRTDPAPLMAQIAP